MLKKEVLKEIVETIDMLREEGDSIPDLPNPQKEDLMYLYEIRKILTEVFKPSILDVRDRKKMTFAKEILQIGVEYAQNVPEQSKLEHTESAMNSELKKMTLK